MCWGLEPVARHGKLRRKRERSTPREAVCNVCRCSFKSRLFPFIFVTKNGEPSQHKAFVATYYSSLTKVRDIFMERLWAFRLRCCYFYIFHVARGLLSSDYNFLSVIKLIRRHVFMHDISLRVENAHKSACVYFVDVCLLSGASRLLGFKMYSRTRSAAASLRCCS